MLVNRRAVLLQMARGAEVGAPQADEHYLLDDNRYVADVLAEFRGARGRDYQSKILFKKRMFRETDETITEPQFVTLSYVQVPASCPGPDAVWPSAKE